MLGMVWMMLSTGSVTARSGRRALAGDAERHADDDGRASEPKRQLTWRPPSCQKLSACVAYSFMTERPLQTPEPG